MLNAVQTDLDAALFPKNLEAKKKPAPAHTPWVGV